ncbi:cytochrome P450 [Infundibulicybe gibba]|nr:cytochrome P450 [Infundibulicybe gibba]
MTTPILSFSAFVGLIVWVLYRRLRRVSVGHICGPKSDSFVFGNMLELLQGQTAEADFKWLEAYGDVVKFKAFLGEDRLLIADPKALQHIYHAAGYNYMKQSWRRELSRIVSGRGILWADGDVHKRHRKVMLPGFGGPETKALLPVVFTYAAQLTQKWKDLIAMTNDQTVVVNIPTWTSRAALDAVGAAAFDYEFGALQNLDNPLGKACENLLSDSFGSVTRADVIRQGVYQACALYCSVADGVAKMLVEEKMEALLKGKGARDIMSLLVKANVAENEKVRLNEEELYAQLRTIIMAGHETTANTLTWTLLELARHPEIQTKLRREIRDMEQSIRSRGRQNFTHSDMDLMPYLTAVLKESMRFHPVAYHIHRQAARDDVIPLSKPIMTTSGKAITEIPISKGTRIIASISGYQRNKEVFGVDADVFNPDRWLDDSVNKSTTVGVYGNLLNFSGGVRSCIGWRFAVQELHAFLIELVDNFEFSLTPEVALIRREACLLMVPTLEGKVDQGTLLPLQIKMASRED